MTGRQGWQWPRSRWQYASLVFWVIASAFWWSSAFQQSFGWLSVFTAVSTTAVVVVHAVDFWLAGLEKP